MTAVPAPTLAERVVRWQASHGRHTLPWQGTRDPYRVWLAEVMLQQTQVATVLGYYARFLQRFPGVENLAAAPIDEVLSLWSGLGYYSRARNLHRCAQVVVQQHGGRFPSTAEELSALPGIGRSTAAAIAAFAFGERVAILDGNVKRVLARALAFDGDLSQGDGQKALWGIAEALMPQRDIERYTQGLMDLGATVCLARDPRCDACPLVSTCRARLEGRPQQYPVKSRRPRRGRRRHALLWLRWCDQVRLVQRPLRGVWAGLWSLPEAASTDAWRMALADAPGEAEALPPIEHALTHFDWTLEPLRWTLPARLPAARAERIAAGCAGGRWFTPGDAASLGLPAPVRRLLGCGRSL